MATQGMFDLFGATPEEIRAKYRQGLMGAPISSVPLQDRPAAMGAGLGRQFGYALGRMLGGTVPGEAEAEARQQAMQQALESGETGSSMYARLAQQYQAAGDYGRAFAAMQQARTLKTEEEAAAAAKKKRDEEGAAKTASEQARLIALRKKFPIKDGKGEYTDEQLQALAKDQTTSERLLGKEVTGTSEFERLLASLPPEEQQALIKKRAEALAAGGTGSSNDDLKRLLIQAQVDKARSDAEAAKDKRERDKRDRVAGLWKEYEALGDGRNDIDAIVAKADRLLAWQAQNPVTNIFQGTLQEIMAKLPGSEESVIQQLTNSLVSANVIQTLMLLKSQSRTGATGFGALSNKELNLLIEAKENLKPSSRDFGTQLKIFIARYKAMAAKMRRAIARHEDIMKLDGLTPPGLPSASTPEAGTTPPPATTTPSAPAGEGRRPLGTF